MSRDELALSCDERVCYRSQQRWTRRAAGPPGPAGMAWTVPIVGSDMDVWLNPAGRATRGLIGRGATALGRGGAYFLGRPLDAC